jgi:hypothetical protein
MAKETLYRSRIIVEGRLRFPYDMLCYDTCVPATERDANEIARTGYSAPVRISLTRFAPAPKTPPSVGRWASFGWRVVEVVYHDGTIERGRQVLCVRQCSDMRTVARGGEGARAEE